MDTKKKTEGSGFLPKRFKRQYEKEEEAMQEGNIAESTDGAGDCPAGPPGPPGVDGLPGGRKFSITVFIVR